MVFQGDLGTFDLVGRFGKETGWFEIGFFQVGGSASILGWRQSAIVCAAEGYFLLGKGFSRAAVRRG
jgi:hypothetical protein